MAAREIASFGPLSRSSSRLRASVRLLFICVFLILTSALAASLVFHRKAALEDGRRRAEDLAFILSDHFTRTASAIDTTLSQIALLHRTLGDGENVPSKYFLSKPYRRTDLAMKLREVLDEPPVQMARLSELHVSTLRHHDDSELRIQQWNCRRRSWPEFSASRG